MQFEIREINKSSLQELTIVAERCMATVLETIPEFQNSAAAAQLVLPNFTHEQMAEMIKNDFLDSSKRIMVAVQEEVVVGQALYSVKIDSEGQPYGFCFNRYVHPDCRRQGIAAALMADAMNWFFTRGVVYVCAHTHVTNLTLQSLFKKFGFSLEGPFQGNWEYYVLKKKLDYSFGKLHLDC